MSCYFPLKAFKAKSKDPQKTAITFRRAESWKGIEISLPCGQCIGCRLDRSRQWAVRCVHEASLYERNSFVTLTYDQVHLPSDRSLHLEHFQNFMKKLRKSVAPNRVRFYHCGEYGEVCKVCGKSLFQHGVGHLYVKAIGRPHYHALLFNHDFENKKYFSERNGNKVYTSDDLSKLWNMGHAVTGDVTFDSASYVARYVMKKITGEKKDEHYGGLKPEYTTMSRRPGIGKEWFEKNVGDVYPRDMVIMRGVHTRPPRFYDGLLGKKDASMLALLKINRERNEKFVTDTLSNGKIIIESDSSARRLAIKEEVKRAEISQLERPLEGQ